MSFDWLHGVLATLVCVYMVADVVKTVAYLLSRKREIREESA